MNRAVEELPLSASRDSLFIVLHGYHPLHVIFVSLPARGYE